MRFRFASLAVLGVAAVVGCSDDTTTTPARGPMFAATQGAGSKQYVIIANAGELPADLAARATAAGGTVSYAMNGIGVAVATSDDPGFAATLGGSGLEVVEDIMLDFDMPTVGPEMLEVASGEPDVGQTAHVGAVETFRALQWAPDAISAPAAWHMGHMGAGVRVAVLDGGIR